MSRLLVLKFPGNGISYPLLSVVDDEARFRYLELIDSHCEEAQLKLESRTDIIFEHDPPKST